MKFLATLALLAPTVLAASGAPAFAITTEKVDGAFANVVTVTSNIGDAHTAADDTFKITLPTGVEIKDGAQTITTDYTFTCTTSGGAAQATTAATYSVTYAKATKIIEIKKLTTTAPCIAGSAVLTLKKAGIFVKDVAATTLKIANSKVTAEATTPVAGTGTVAYAAATAGTLAGLAAPSVVGTTSKFEIKFTSAITAATTEFIHVTLPGYTVSSPACKVGTTTATVSGGTTDSRFGYILVTGATSLWTANAQATLTCDTGVTASTKQAASNVYVCLGVTANAKECSSLTLPAVTTKAPTAFSGSARVSSSIFVVAVLGAAAVFF
mmetsp:Transcript_19324/g.27115  ORF Transcript_19324/g.27115 Transcript_19324/m.27115 type:complete len:325 (+) Transcript_19324:40-1014(+)|eukprot:CAMPEP_0175099440 /NCGR_PEP_ID=MMETSP0086_2-20121207/6457_1 /TAXON_ID=136419 /ORGANISM="Unknown Unknown, Strain D1" /LENGTH=324 /DNA_ID=CAMNT_0016373289 /DNA_START=36 /DNA_END=1010 /DNA_ORIENTATION=+